MILFKNKNNNGFTFIELIVVISIFVIISFFTVLSQRSVGGGQKVRMSAQKMASDIRKMQSYVLNLQDHNGSFPKGGWGIYAVKGENKYTLFADDNGNYYYDVAEKSMDILLQAGITISNIDIDSHIDEDDVSIDFSPPDPKTHICQDNDPACTNATNNVVEITLSNGSVSKIIEVNKYGLIDVQN